MLIAGFPAGSFATNCYVVAPGPGEETVEVRARTSFGDIDVRRASVLVDQDR